MPSVHHSPHVAPSIVDIGSLWTTIKCAFTAFFLFHSAVHCAPAVAPRGTTTFQSSYGPITGADMGNGVVRITLPFAQPPLNDLRFANPQPIKTLPLNYNASQTRPQCYQDVGVRGGNEASEDCLYTTYYIPSSKGGVAKQSNMPVMVWFHGGSGIAGGSSQAGLDGSVWAARENVIVAVPQYRLGIFGWLQTNATFDEQRGGAPGANSLAGNQAMRDAVMALQQIRDGATAFGGDPSHVTIMGQSSGATMVRALLVTPSAQSLFNNAILVSDPNTYGFSTPDDNNALGASAMAYVGCALNDVQCARAQSADDLLYATWSAYSDVPQANPRVSQGTPWRAVVGSFVNPSSGGGGKSVIMTTVRNEMGSVVGSAFNATQVGASLLYLTGDTSDTGYGMDQAVDLIFNGQRGEQLSGIQPSLYTVNQTQLDGMRTTFEEATTDGVWRCSTQLRASQRTLAGASSSQVFLAEWQIGATYASNVGNQYCEAKGNVCHEDDIYLIFGTASAMNDAQRKASQEMQSRMAQFARSNAPSLSSSSATTWKPVSSASKLNMLIVNPDGTTSVTQQHHPAACGGSSWGNVVKFDWQLYPSP